MTDPAAGTFITGMAPDDDTDDWERECEGHPAGPSDPMGETVYCDGSCVTD
jgi:hypothetical protein